MSEVVASFNFEFLVERLNPAIIHVMEQRTGLEGQAAVEQFVTDCIFNFKDPQQEVDKIRKELKD